jgi:hypothetical protein
MSFWSQKTAAIGQKKYGLVKKQGSALQPQSAAVAAALEWALLSDVTV